MFLCCKTLQKNEQIIELAVIWDAMTFMWRHCNVSSVCVAHDDVIKWKHFPRYWPFYAGNSQVTGEFSGQRPVTRSFDVFFDLRLNRRLRKQSWGWWFETLSRPLWRHCNDLSGLSSGLLLCCIRNKQSIGGGYLQEMFNFGEKSDTKICCLRI